MTFLAWFFLALLIHFIIAFVVFVICASDSDRARGVIFALAWEIILAINVYDVVYALYRSEMYNHGRDIWFRMRPSGSIYDKCAGELEIFDPADDIALFDTAHIDDIDVPIPENESRYVCKTCRVLFDLSIDELRDLRKSGHQRVCDEWLKFK